MRYRVFSDRVVSKAMDGEAVIINLDTGMYYGLDGPAATVWELLAAGLPVATIAEDIGRQYPAEPHAAAGFDALVIALCDAQLLAAIPAGDDTAPLPAETITWPVAFEPIALVAYDDVAEMIALDPPLPEFNPAPPGL
jgi:hypothetical protein